VKRRTMVAGLVAGALTGTTHVRAQSVPADAAASLAPTGRVRIAINHGNVALAQRDPNTGKLSGVSVDIAEELGRRVGLPVTLVPFDAAGKVSAAAASNVWDVAFLALDPERAREILFTAAYVVINGNYVVRKDAPWTAVNEVDRDDVRISVSNKSVYDLFLTRSLKHAKIVRAGNPREAAAVFQSERLEACAGVQSAMQQLVATDPTLRMIAEPFMQINQAMGTPAGRTAAAAYLKRFVEAIKAEGFVAKALARNGQSDASVAPPG
jgi:polar amino acid transport system substrate-binding protein